MIAAEEENIPLQTIEINSSVRISKKAKQASRCYEGVTAFVGNLYNMLNDDDCHQAIRYELICPMVTIWHWAFSWTETGKEVWLAGKDELGVPGVLNKYFAHNSYRTLTKTLNAYGFRRVRVVYFLILAAP